jgi:Asp-tRNA(Asn)/Glu-tRNA(Gln) amidotransferase A subunit family amidase
MTTPLTLHPDAGATIEGVGRALRAGRTTCAAVLDHCFRQIDVWDDRVHAWVFVDRSGAMNQARQRDAELAAGRCRGPLHGIPFGVKDIIDVSGMPTAAGFGPWRDRVAACDAGVVALLRSAGAVILGKTVTTQFAWIDPPVTRNPWNTDRTPGGSSSGSAAAVATGMCLGALGTQTGGSILRPASFCGVAGVKPNYLELPCDGIVPFAPSLDHLGVIARTCRDLALIFERTFEDPDLRADDPAEQTIAQFEAKRTWFDSHPSDLPRLGRLRGFYDRRADPVVRAATDRAVAALAAAGAEVIDVLDETVGLDFDEILWQHRLIMAAEAAAGHEARLAEHRGDYAPLIRALVEEGLTLSASHYIRVWQAWHAGPRFRPSRDRRSKWETMELDAYITPTTLTAAPDRVTTGDPAFNSPWSFLGLPAVTFPIGLSPNGLPLGLQLVEHVNGHYVVFLQQATWCEDAIRRANGRD